MYIITYIIFKETSVMKRALSETEVRIPSFQDGIDRPPSLIPFGLRGFFRLARRLVFLSGKEDWSGTRRSMRYPSTRASMSCSILASPMYSPFSNLLTVLRDTADLSASSACVMGYAMRHRLSPVEGGLPHKLRYRHRDSGARQALQEDAEPDAQGQEGRGPHIADLRRPGRVSRGSFFYLPSNG